MSAKAIVDILQLGLGGLAFLLALFAFRLLLSEQKQQAPRAEILRSTKLYMYQCMGLAVIVALFQVVVPRLLPGPSPEKIARCRDSLSLLKLRRERADALVHLTSAIDEHAIQCEELLRTMDEQR